jgi:galactose mutarotase-like enzyme
VFLVAAIDRRKPKKEKIMNSITHGKLTVSAQTRGAELCSIRGTDGIEYLWQADPTFWKGQAPILFPTVGKLQDGRYQLNGQTYEMASHGFARTMDFTLIDQQPDALTYQLLPTAETRARYPFEFSLTVIYRLNGNALSIEYAVRNTGASVMPFSIGCHEAYNLPGPLEECFLEFEKMETSDPCLINAKGMVSADTVSVMKNTRTLPLSKTLFDRDALIFLDVKSKKITLGAKNSPRRLTVEFAGFPQLGIWAKPAAPFVCIEPWFGHSDPEHPYGDIWKKPGIIHLEAGKTFVCTHQISIQ